MTERLRGTADSAPLRGPERGPPPPAAACLCQHGRQGRDRRAETGTAAGRELPHAFVGGGVHSYSRTSFGK